MSDDAVNDFRGEQIDVDTDLFNPANSPSAHPYLLTGPGTPWRSGTGPGTSVPLMSRQGDEFRCVHCLDPAVAHSPISHDHAPETFGRGRTPGVHPYAEDPRIGEYHHRSRGGR